MTDVGQRSCLPPVVEEATSSRENASSPASCIRVRTIEASITATMRAQTCFRYVLSVLLGGYAEELCEAGRIVYAPTDDLSDRANAQVRIVPSGLFGESYGRPESLPSCPLTEIEGVPLPFGRPEVRRDGDSLIVSADIIASAYFLLTRYEEMIRREVRDRHGRFPGRASLPFRAGFLDRPIVDEYAALLRKWLGEVGVHVPEPKRRFSVLLTHDVDSVRAYHNPLRTAAGALLGRRRTRDVIDNVAVLAGLRNDPLAVTFEEVQRLDGMLAAEKSDTGVEVIYFFEAGGRSRFDGNYDPRYRRAGEILRNTIDSGATIGLHTSYDAGVDPKRIASEKAVLEEAAGFPIRHNRHHFLAWRNIEDGHALAQAGLDWDATLGYADMAGFRLGVCHPIPLFDPVRLEPFGIEEHPLMLMDCTLSEPGYMGLDPDEARAYTGKLASTVRHHNGELTLLWHHTRFIPRPGNYHPELYRNLLCEAAGETVAVGGDA